MGIGKSDTLTVQYELDEAREPRTGHGKATRKQRSSSEHELRESPAQSLTGAAVGTQEFPDAHRFRTGM